VSRELARPKASGQADLDESRTPGDGMSMTMANAPQGYYAASAKPAAAHATLSGPINADVCVIGAGYTGLSAALHLAQSGAKVAVLEADTVGFAASGRNGGQIHTGHRKTQAYLETWLGKIHARELWDLCEESKAAVRLLVRAHSIDCDLKNGLVIAAHNRAAIADLARETEHLSKHYGYAAARMLDRDETERVLGTRAYPAARMDLGGGHLHPLNYARGLASAAARAGARIFEHSRVVTFDEDRAGVHARCRHGTVRAGRLLLACDAFSGDIAPELAKFIGQLESFVTATAPLGEKLCAAVLPCDAAVADTRHVLDYYRKSADGRMLYAGRESYWTTPKDIAAIVRPRMLSVFPELRDVPTEYAWSGTVGITATRMPHFGRLSERVLFAHGYSGQGVALASLGGRLLAEAALGNPERFEVFARVPATPFPGGRLLRKPIVSAALMWFKLMDAL
jgi:gamma-glutamylputrescine oxidase